jgi:hypothetical protein
MKSVLFRIFLVVFVLFASSYSFESKKRLLLNGIVVSKNMKLKDVDISIFENGKLKNVLRTDQKGEVIVKLNFNSTYNIFYNKIGYSTKEVFVDTKVKSNIKFFQFFYKIELNRIAKYEPIKKDRVAAIIKYNNKNNSFDCFVPDSLLKPITN